VLFEVRKQKFLELLYGQALTPAVVELVDGLKECEDKCSREEFNSLCYILTLSKLSDHPDYKHWTPYKGRMMCFERIRSELEQLYEDMTSAEALSKMEPNRLVKLLKQSLVYQVSVYRSVNPDEQLPNPLFLTLLNDFDPVTSQAAAAAAKEIPQLSTAEDDRNTHNPSAALSQKVPERAIHRPRTAMNVHASTNSGYRPAAVAASHSNNPNPNPSHHQQPLQQPSHLPVREDSRPEPTGGVHYPAAVAWNIDLENMQPSSSVDFGAPTGDGDGDDGNVHNGLIDPPRRLSQQFEAQPFGGWSDVEPEGLQPAHPPPHHPPLPNPPRQPAISQWPSEPRRQLPFHAVTYDLFQPSRMTTTGLLREPQAIRVVEFSPSGSNFCVGTNAKMLKICSALPFEEMCQHPPEKGISTQLQIPVVHTRQNLHGGSVYCAAWHREGHVLVTGSNDRSLKVLHFNQHWESSASEDLVLLGHSGTVRACAFLGHSSQVVSGGGGDCHLRLWDAEAGSCLLVLEGHSDQIFGIRASLDGSVLVTASQDRTVRLWDVRARKCVRALSSAGVPASSVDLSPTANTVAAGYVDGSCVLYDITSGRPMYDFHYHTMDCHALRFSPDGRWIATASFDGTASILDMSAGAVVHNMSDHTDKVIATSWHPQWPLLLTSSTDRTVRLWSSRMT
jgi:WD repeat-containing protein 47